MYIREMNKDDGYDERWSLNMEQGEICFSLQHRMWDMSICLTKC